MGDELAKDCPHIETNPTTAFEFFNYKGGQDEDFIALFAINSIVFLLSCRILRGRKFTVFKDTNK